MMPCLLFYSSLTLTRIFNFSWLNGFDLQHIALSKKKNDADWLDSRIPLGEFKPRAVVRPLKHLTSPRQSCFSSRRTLIHICFNVSAFGTKLLGNTRERAQPSLWRKSCRRLTAAVKSSGAEWNGSRGERGWRKQNNSSLFVMQNCGCARCWITHKPRQKASQEQVKKKERSAERRTSGQTKVMMMNGDFPAMTSLFPQGDTCCLTRSRMQLKSQERNKITNAMIVQMHAHPSVSTAVLDIWNSSFSATPRCLI